MSEGGGEEEKGEGEVVMVGKEEEGGIVISSVFVLGVGAGGSVAGSDGCG